MPTLLTEYLGTCILRTKWILDIRMKYTRGRGGDISKTGGGHLVFLGVFVLRILWQTPDRAASRHVLARASV